MSVYARYKKIPLMTKLAIGMGLGVAVGLFWGKEAAALQPFGYLFLSLLKMACIPLVLANLISGIASLDDPKMLGRIGGKLIGFFFFITLFGALWGIAYGLYFQPGLGVTLAGDFNVKSAAMPSALETLFAMVPGNIFQALSAGRLDQIVVFAIFAGLAVLMCKPSDRVMLASFASALSNMFGRMVGIIMGYAPFGVLSLVASVVGIYGHSILGPALKLVIVMYLGFASQFLLFMLIVLLVTRRSPLWFLKKSMPVIMTAASTQSSLATLPVTLQTAEDLGIKKSIFSFTVPLGAQICKDGHAIVLLLSLIFASQIGGITLTVPELIQAILIALLLTTGSGGIPGGGFITITIMLTAFKMPPESIALIGGIFFLIDSGNTVINTYGDLLGAYFVDQTEKDTESDQPQLELHSQESTD